MKKMTCKQLSGACDKVFQANTFEEMAELSKQHGMEMFAKQDPDHLEAIGKIQAMMMNPTAMQEWFEGKRKEFDALSEE